MMVSDNCRCHPYDKCRKALKKKQIKKTINCLVFHDFPHEYCHLIILCDEHSSRYNGMEAVISCQLDCGAAVLLSCLLFSHTDTSPQFSAGPQTTGYVRLQCDQSVWQRPHPPYQKGYRTMLTFFSAISFFFFSHCFLSSFSLSHTRTHTLTLDMSVLMWQVRDSCLRQCRCAWGYLGLWSAPLPGTRNTTVSS